jgi:hypothetical protein
MTDDSDAKSPDGLHESWRGLSRQERRRLTAENKNDWLEFPGLSGTHLSWRKEESGSWELLSDRGAIWATRHRNSITASGQNYEIRHVMKSKRRNFILDRVLRKELVDSAGFAVLSWTWGPLQGQCGHSPVHRREELRIPRPGKQVQREDSHARSRSWWIWLTDSAIPIDLRLVPRRAGQEPSSSRSCREP